ncbi:MAG: hypothetical protein AAF531_25075 [Actinomycetota bacterium]
MKTITRLTTFVLPFILVGAGIMKFTTGHVFQYLEYQTGIDVLHPYLNNLVGAAEISAGILLRFRRTRRAGSLLALAIIGGAVVAHLTPWLGISPPIGLVDGAAAPWTAADFTTETSASLFVTAIVTLALSVVVALPELRPSKDPSTTPVAPPAAPDRQPLPTA